MGETGLSGWNIISQLMNFTAGYFLLMAISAIITLAAQIFLSFIIAEDAFLKGSRHSIRWGVFAFFFTWWTVIIYYLTIHRQTEAQAFCSLSFIRKVIKADKIKLKIILWILGIFGALVALATIAIVLLAIFTGSSGSSCPIPI